MKEYDAIVLGAGPVGATAALLLHKAGLRVAVVETRVEPSGHPAGHVINPRSMEIWRHIDPELEQTIRNDSAAVEDIRHIVWCTTLSGRELGRINIVPDSSEKLADQLAYSPSRHLNYPQSRLERTLWGWIWKSPEIDFFNGYTMLVFDQDKEGVSLIADNNSNEIHLSGRYMLAADGARSSVRQQLGINMPGPLILRVASVHFRANLDRFVRGRPAVIYWIYNSDVMGPLVKHLNYEWVLMTVLHPPQNPEDFTEARWRELIHSTIGSRAVDVEIDAIGTWAMTAQVADRFADGRIFLVGDAAHRFPPTGGYGTNTGVQDAHNLVWKLRAVLNGQAGAALLDTYEMERRPVAIKNCQQSIDNLEEMESINEAVGIRMETMKKAHALMESRLFKALPKGIQLRAADSLQKLGLYRLSLLDSNTGIGRRTRARLDAAVRQQRAHFGAHGVELGYCYAGPLTLPVPANADEQSSVLEYVPSTLPGGRLPHAWVFANGKKVSTLDLIPDQGLTLIVDPAWQQHWQAVLDACQPLLSLPLNLIAIDDQESHGISRKHRWYYRRGVGPSGAVLVRPDGHVVWRTRAMPAAPAETFRSVIKHLGKVVQAVVVMQSKEGKG